eukprot:CAMPEP_0204916914 /NCGR_PEP_ID=MMETSP1397-20131031/14624_1 /ASSEMBLY_ACC=CAM_ASM_000891 /TAXON_ID=49980 /ORGANISM="Climacostomum Climacostomum virens, Strain Stock W-24" /LENGTH=443 /DNA_ID=CAMNT_0052089595 /DNA_START=57 /DNA_END=1385 /DNA_ORIENTATION=-
MAAINEALQPFAELVGLPLDHLKLVICFFSVTPLGWIQWRLIRGRLQRHLYSIILGLLLYSFAFGLNNTLYFLGFSIVPLTILYTLPKTKLAMPTFIYGFGLVFAVQMKRILYPGPRWAMDDTSLYMIGALKYVSLAFCIQDSETIRTHPKKISPNQREYIVETLPSILEFYSYVCFFPTFLVGPTIEYRQYIAFIELRDAFASIPSPIRVSLVRLLQGTVLIVMVVSIGTKLSYNYLLTDEFYELPYLNKLFYIWITGEAARLRFYLAWKFSEAGAIASGFGYNGTTSKGEDWDRVMGIRILGVELAQNVKVLFEHWNVSVADWLRRYSYERIVYSSDNPTAATRSWAQHQTFILSAVWHGFQPGYLIFFLNCSVLGEVNKLLYVRDFTYLPGYTYLKFLGTVANGMMINYLGASFVLLSLRDVYTGYGSLNFVPLIILYTL